MIKSGIILTNLNLDTKYTSVLSNKKILFTGKLSIPRNIAKEKAEKQGAEISSVITNKLDYLIVGEKPGMKLKKAKELGITILTEIEFNDILDKNHV